MLEDGQVKIQLTEPVNSRKIKNICPNQTFFNQQFICLSFKNLPQMLRTLSFKIKKVNRCNKR